MPVADYSLTAQALPDYAQVSSQTAQDAAITGTPQQGSADNLQNASSTAISSNRASAQSSTPAPASSDMLQSTANYQNQEASTSELRGSTHERRATGALAECSQPGSEGHEASRLPQGRHGHGSQQKQERQGSSERQQQRGVYSFCMCPGGQIVPTSTNPEELCINGMSFRSVPPLPIVGNTIGLLHSNTKLLIHNLAYGNN